MKQQTKSLPGENLTSRRKRWLAAITGDDSNCIQLQLIQFGLDLATFEMINEARRLATRKTDASIPANGLFHGLFDRGFFTIALSSIRRQCDTYPIDGNKGVIGLAPLLKDISAHATLLTRSAILEAEGLPYDFAPGLDEHYRILRDSVVPGQAFNSAITPSHWSEMRHEILDKACGVQREHRSPEDLYDVRILDQLLHRVQAAGEKAKNHVDKFIAHASSAESRSTRSAEDFSITLQDLRDVHRVLCETTAFVSVDFLNDSCPAFLPTTAFDPTAELDRPLLDSRNRSVLARVWERQMAAAEEAARWGRDDFAREFNPRTT